VHRTVFGAQAGSTTNSSLSGIHRGRFGYNSPDCPVSQRSEARSTGNTWPEPTITWTHLTVWCAPDSVRCAKGPRAQRSALPEKEGDRAPDRDLKGKCALGPFLSILVI
jgi:hypothetical protein